jgi:hypothetical protein
MNNVCVGKANSNLALAKFSKISKFISVCTPRMSAPGEM